MKTICTLSNKLNSDIIDRIKDFSLRLFKHSENEMSRFNLTDVVTMIDSYDQLSDHKIISIQ